MTVSEDLLSVLQSSRDSGGRSVWEIWVKAWEQRKDWNESGTKDGSWKGPTFGGDDRPGWTVCLQGSR